MDLPADIPDGELDVLVLDGLDVEAWVELLASSKNDIDHRPRHSRD